MSADTGNAPSWLFSFVDLAFLSLIAMTQLSSSVDVSSPNLGEMVVPRIGSEATDTLATGAADLWQLRVHPPDSAQVSPFELFLASGHAASDESPRLAITELRERLLGLRAAEDTKPLLAPHEDSRSQDMLNAAALIEELWPSRRRALVSRSTEPS
ncbi:MAG: hypothetical protein JRG96_00975 [Deltaproteobacteria bacterium]|nr:hypothetical protein [Deltaproteobacteria bacterium]MBW2417358.1 hypothetical protein [Deltaproteobacteria bacterium]